MVAINERIKHLRTTLKMTQADFAKAIHISNGYIADMELGNRKVNDRIVRLITLTFGISEAWLRGGEGDMYGSTPSDKLQRMSRLFNELPPKFQDYVMIQIEQLVAAIESDYL